VRVIDNDLASARQQLQVLAQRSQCPVVRKHSVRQQNYSRTFAQLSDRFRNSFGISVRKFNNARFKKRQAIAQTLMRPRINERMRKLARQRLRHYKICGVTIGDERRALHRKKADELRFQLLIDFVIAGSEARRRNVQAESLQPFLDRSNNFAMAGEPKIVAAPKINELPAVRKHI